MVKRSQQQIRESIEQSDDDEYDESEPTFEQYMTEDDKTFFKQEIENSNELEDDEDNIDEETNNEV